MRRPVSPRIPLRAVLCAGLCLVGCSSLGSGEKGGGGASLPNRGVSGYQLIVSPLAELDEETGEPDPDAPSFVVLDTPETPVTRRSPTALVTDDGRIVLYYEEVADGTSRVMRAESQDGITFSAPAIVFEQGNPTSPAVTSLPPQTGGDVREADRGGGGGFTLVHGLADGSAILAADSDDGLVFTPRAEPLLTPQGPEEAGGIGEPSLVVDDSGRHVLFYEAITGDDRPFRRIRRAVSEDGGATFTRAGTALDLGTGCLDRDGEEARCWDAQSVGQPEVRLGRDAFDRRIWRMTYSGGTAPTPNSLGLAFSFDGESWSRYPYNPLLESDWSTPSNAYRDGAYYLYATQNAGRDGTSISLAISDFGHATETF